MSLSDLTHDELDELAERYDLDDYPTSGVKADKVAALDGAGVQADLDGDELSNDDRPFEVVRLSPGEVSPTLQAAADAERARARELLGRTADDLAARSRHANVSDRSRRVAEATAAREVEGASEVSRIIDGLPADREG